METPNEDIMSKLSLILMLEKMIDYLDDESKKLTLTPAVQQQIFESIKHYFD